MNSGLGFLFFAPLDVRFISLAIDFERKSAFTWILRALTSYRGILSNDARIVSHL